MKTLITTAMILLGLVLLADATNALLYDTFTSALLPLLSGATILTLAVIKIRAPLLIRIENRQYFSYE